MSGPWIELRTVVARATPVLRTILDGTAAIPRAPGKWSPKEVIGHLIDSATNNHGRFVRAQLTDSLRGEGYAQDEWVRVQHYRDTDWLELVGLWEQLNLHLARVMENTPAEVRTRIRTDHNLDVIAFQTRPTDAPVSLKYFMNDYVEHLKYHLRQVLPDDQ